MSVNEWESLADVWQSQETPAELSMRYRRRLTVTVIGEIALVAFFVALSFAAMRDGLAAWETVWLASLWIFTTVAMAFAWWNRRGTWSDASVSEYVALARLRCERQRRSIFFAIALFVAETVAVIAQLAWFDRLTPIAIVLLWISGCIVAAWCAATMRRIRRELEVIASFDRFAGE